MMRKRKPTLGNIISTILSVVLVLALVLSVILFPEHTIGKLFPGGSTLATEPTPTDAPPTVPTDPTGPTEPPQFRYEIKATNWEDDETELIFKVESESQQFKDQVTKKYHADHIVLEGWLTEPAVVDVEIQYYEYQSALLQVVHTIETVKLQITYVEEINDYIIEMIGHWLPSDDNENPQTTTGNMFISHDYCFSYTVEPTDWATDPRKDHGFDVSVSYGSTVVHAMEQNKHIFISNFTGQTIVLGYFDDPTDMTIHITDKVTGELIEELTFRVTFDDEIWKYAFELLDLKRY